MADFTGELAALGTAIMFSFGSTMFTFAGREIGSPLVNRTRLLVAILFIIGWHWLQFGEPLPLNAGAEPWFWLGISGFVGLALGDASLFQAFVLVGPRISMLMMALAPVFSAVFAWILLGETLSAQSLVGIGLTMGGIALVISERNSRKEKRGGSSIAAETPREYLIGLLFGLGGALGQAGGLVLSKIGLANDFPALSGNLIRITVAVIAIWGFSLLRREIVSSVRTLRQHPRAFLLLSGGAITGPVIGVWLSLVAVQNAPVGVASTLMALTPIFLLPIGYIVFKETISKQAIFGTVVAFLGTVLLFT